MPSEGETNQRLAHRNPDSSFEPGPIFGPLAAFVRHSSILCRSSPATYARLVPRASGEVMVLPRTAEPRSQIISRSCTEECSACANLSRRGRFHLNTADPILEREPPSSALGQQPTKSPIVCLG